ncbi:NADPH-dependent FMN reductase [Paenibacillus mendelii]|uniref:NADPH-dependent FMN reductase n=1 Tax=Paenibacillus mendelii TaxID=206163 RepID=A0ABV6JP38_9BACL|nr:NAD(P)H-dependent oxidoreductase [Paenibacillus mendelii]MCQ6560585.1 NAD(P)H-dependent oxidoreductase [Paenibacillus mendelii]
MKIQIIIGSVREGRRGKSIGEWAFHTAAARGDVQVELIDLKEWDLPMYDLAKPPILGQYEDPLQQRWADKIKEADGYLFISPEYNHSFTSALKNALDYLYEEWGRKPASFIGYGPTGGIRGIEQLRLVLIELKMAALGSALHLTKVHEKIVNNRFIASDHDTSSLNHALDDLLWWSRALSEAKKNQD